MPAILVAGGLTLAYPCWASPFDIGGDDWEGCRDFVELSRAELGTDRVIASTTLDYNALQPTDGIVIVGPSRSLDVASLAAFMRAGGRVAILDDFGRGDALLEHFRIRRVPLPAHPESALRGNPALAIAVPSSNHPLAIDVAHLVTNHATGLERSGLSGVLAVKDAASGNQVQLALVGAVGDTAPAKPGGPPSSSPGRLVAVGDGSFVINSMIGFADNATFARHIVHYVVEDDGPGTRRGRLFIASGSFDQAGAFGPTSQIASTLQGLRRRLVDTWNESVKNGPPPFVTLALALGVLTLLVAWSLARAARPYTVQAPRHVRPFPKKTLGRAEQLLDSPRAALLTLFEWRHAAVETLSMLLKLERAPRSKDLVARAREAGLIDDLDAEWLAKELGRIGRLTPTARIRSRDVVASGNRISALMNRAIVRAASRPPVEIG